MSKHVILFALLLTVALAGCFEPKKKKKVAEVISPERTYANMIMLGDTDLGEGWMEVDRAVVTRTRYGNIDKSYTRRSPLLPDHGKDFLEDYPIVGIIAYGDCSPESKPISMRVTYLYERYKALPLPKDTKIDERLNAGTKQACSWALGEDGVARADLPAGAVKNSKDTSGMLVGAIDPDNEKIIYLAGFGVTVEIRTSKRIDKKRLDKAVAAIRKRLAFYLDREKRYLEVLNKQHVAYSERAILKEFASERTKRILGAFDMVFNGRIYKKKF